MKRLFGAALLVLLSGCATTGGQSPEQVRVVVDNQSWDGVRLYAQVGSSTPRRVGFAGALSRERFSVDCGFFRDRTVNFVLHVLAGGRYQLRGEPVSRCSDMVEVIVPAGGPRYATVAIRGEEVSRASPRPRVRYYTERERFIAPTPQMLAAWQAAEQCLDMEGDLSRVGWWTAHVILRVGPTIGDIQPLAGMRHGPRIVVRARYLEREKLLRHEAIHMILAQNGQDPDGRHQGEFWKECEAL